MASTPEAEPGRRGARSTLSWPLAFVVVVVAAACAKDTGPAFDDNEYHPSFYTTADGQEIRSELATAFAEAQVDAEIRAARDVPAGDLPAWMKGKDGWIVYVTSRHRTKAGAVWQAWLESRGTVVEEPARSRPMLVLGAEKPLPRETVASIQAELKKRYRIDQDVRRDPARHGQMKQVDADNTAWLKKTVVAHGWIDVARFGTKAADAAFLFVQHSGDLGLMNAALPKIERDVRAGRLSAQNFALLFDRLQIIQGGQQRYGTQVMQDDKTGDWIVGRLEDPDRVDERRKTIGLGPLEDYLARFGHAVRIER